MAIKKYYVTVNEEGTIRWYKDAKCKILHRENGPAVLYADGSKVWYINDNAMTEAEFLAATQPVVELTVDDVEKLVGKRVKIIK